MKALASDFDGTLFINHEFSPVDLDTIKGFQDKGNLFGVSTGRCLEEVLREGEVVDYDFYIGSGGASIHNKEKEVIYFKELDFEVIKEILDELNEIFPCTVHSDTNVYPIANDRYGSRVESIEELRGKKLCFLSIYCKTPENVEIAKKVASKYLDKIDACQNKVHLDIVAKGASKGNAIKFLKEYYQLDDIASIGDSYNDISMLDEAKLSFTFNDSFEEVKSHASNLVDSVAEAITYINDLA